MRALVSDKIFEGGVEKLRQEPDIEVDVHTGLPPDELRERIGSYDALIVRSETKVDAGLIAKAARLKVIGRAGVGVDNIDVPAATRQGILVVNAPEGNTVACAELTVALLLATARNVPQAYDSLVRERAWERSRFMGSQLQGKTMGIIGLGRIGTEVVKRVQAFEMKVVAHDPFISQERARRLGVRLATVDQLCAEADFISIHCPLTKETAHLIGDRQFALMKDGVRIVNCARGGIVDEDALLRAIKAGKVAGAALDVFESEPSVGSALLDLPQVIATPHLGASTLEAQMNVAIDVVDEIIRALHGKPVRNAVNMPPVNAELVPVVQPYLELGEKLGRLYTTILGGAGHQRVEVIYAGEAASLETTHLTSAVLKGMLDPILHEKVNLVNAMMLAMERDVQVAEVRDPKAGDFSSLLTVRTRTEKGDRMVAGTLSAGGYPRLAMIDGYEINVPTRGYMLIAYHTDRPGIIGQVGTILGRGLINIAAMQVGRMSTGGDAVMVLSVDSPVPPPVLQELRDVDKLKEVLFVEW
ncbi:MAG: phosphoglycerate dehydrogenase [Firmicutes bacterium]|nr:phosphoglycerate dehydrogenase [Bacillota bacterium]